MARFTITRNGSPIRETFAFHARFHSGHTTVVESTMSVRIVRIKDTSSCFQLYFGPSTFLVGSLFEFDDSNHAALKHLFGNETVQIDYIILLDAHLTTCGNLPIILNELGYTGAIFSTDATRLLAPLLLSEFMYVKCLGFLEILSTYKYDWI